jgi:F-type H+-transporting ATPase subunit b
MTTTVFRLIASRRSRPALATWLAGPALMALVMIGATPRVVAAQAPAHAAAAPAEEHADAAHGEEAHDAGWKPTIAKTFNFALLVGVLVYFLRTPLAGHLMTRGTQVRADLDAAARLTESASAQIAEIEARLKSLPAELEALRALGAAEIKAEEQRIHEVADAERARLLSQAAHAIDQHLQMARRTLVQHAADLAISTADQRLRQQITDDDRSRLFDRYLTEVGPHE